MYRLIWDHVKGAHKARLIGQLCQLINFIFPGVKVHNAPGEEAFPRGWDLSGGAGNSGGGGSSGLGGAGGYASNAFGRV